MSGIANFLPGKARLPRPENTRWCLYAIGKGIINPVPATGKVLRSDGSEFKEYENKDGYKYIKVFMHSTDFHFYVHKCVYLKVHGKIPKGKELDHDDGNLSNNTGTNIIARTMLQNLKKRRYIKEPEPAL
jgi:hypothetical protein